MLEWRKKHTTNKKRTIDFYRETVSAVFRIMEATDCHMMPYRIQKVTDNKLGMIDESDVKKIIEYMEKTDKAIATQKGYIRALNVYCRHYGNNVIKRMDIRWPEDTRPKVDWLTTDQMRALIQYPMNPLQELAVNLMGRMGLRRVECIRMKLKDIMSGYVVVRGKGRMSGKLRNVPLRNNMGPILERYMKYREEIIATARMKIPDICVPEEVFINWNQGLLRPYDEDGWGFDKAVIVPLRKSLGFPFFKSYITPDVRKNAVGCRCRSADYCNDPWAQLNGSYDQISRHTHGRYGICHVPDAVLSAVGE